MKLISVLSLLTVVCAPFGRAMAQEKAEAPDLLSSGFGPTLVGWDHSGEVSVVGKAVRFAPGKASLSRRFAIPGLHVVFFGTSLRPSGAGTDAKVRVRCFDAADRLMMDVDASLDPKKSEAGVYFKTHAFTKYIVVGIEKKGPGTLDADAPHLRDEDGGRKAHRPEADLDGYMEPIWKGGKVRDEAVLLLSEGGKPASGKLLFRPKQILSVSDSSLHVKYVEGRDYRIEGSRLTVVPGSAIPAMRDSDFPKTEYPWVNIAGKHVKVTYTHDDVWKGPVPGYEGAHFPLTMAKLARRQPVNIVALGDSITLGINVSSYLGLPPYTPTWADLFARQLRKIYGYDGIKMYNGGLGGMTASWGVLNARDTVRSLHPDLVLIAFGMNDFWSVDAAQFAKSVRDIVREVRKESPRVEVLLVSSMKFDPAYTADPNYAGHLASYSGALRGLVGRGVGLLDMTEMTDFLYQEKKAKDFMTDPMHPNDFLARCYAQGLVTVLDKRMRGRHFYLSSSGNDRADGLTEAHAWRSLSRIGKDPLRPGDEIILRGGDTFTGSIELGKQTAGTPEAPIVIRSGAKPATIVSPEHPAIKAYRGGIEIRDLVLVGKAKKAREHHDGISLTSEGAQWQRYVRVENVDISGFGGSGISMGAAKESLNGFEDIRISKCSLHGNYTSGITTGDDTAWRGKGYAHKDLLITDCDASKNLGGTGMVISGVDGGVIEYCRANANAGAGGGVGLWAWSARNLVFRYCIASATFSGGGDGGGFDLDGGCFGCVVEHCLAYDNAGPGYMHCDYPEAPPTRNNSIRTSVSLDDGRKAKGDNIGFGYVTWGSGLDDCLIERNLAILTKADAKKQERGVFFVTLVEGSKAKEDVLHVKGGVFRENVAEVAAPGSAFVQNGLPTANLADVLFEGNDYRSAFSLPFLEGGKRYESLAAWRSANGQEQGRSTARSLNYRNLRTLRPRDLPTLFRHF